MPEIFIRKIEPGELMPFGGGNGMVTHTEGGYPFRWGGFQSVAWRQLRAIRSSGVLTEEDKAKIKGIIAELDSRHKSPLHSLYQNAESLLAERGNP